MYHTIARHRCKGNSVKGNDFSIDSLLPRHRAGRREMSSDCHLDIPFNFSEFHFLGLEKFQVPSSGKPYHLPKKEELGTGLRCGISVPGIGYLVKSRLKNVELAQGFLKEILLLPQGLSEECFPTPLPRNIPKPDKNRHLFLASWRL
jgi:hypothetical protein